MEPARPLSTGLGPVSAPPFSLGSGSSHRPHATSRARRPHATRRAAARASAATHWPPARCAASASRSSPSRTRAPGEDAPRRSRCAGRTGFRSTPAGRRAAFGPDSETAAAAWAATARSAPTARPRQPMATRASASPSSLTTDADLLRPQRTGPFIVLEALSLDPPFFWPAQRFGHRLGFGAMSRRPLAGLVPPGCSMGSGERFQPVPRPRRAPRSGRRVWRRNREAAWSLRRAAGSPAVARARG